MGNAFKLLPPPPQPVARLTEADRRRAFWQTTDPATRIELRHFAGPAIYSEQLGRPLRVAHLTDQHVGLVTPMRVQTAAVRIANAQSPDLVVLTGDFVCHSHAYLADLREIVSAIRAPVFAVMGNHDHWAGAQRVRKALTRAGVEILDNASTVIELGHERLQLVGLDDAYTGHADRRRALRGMRADLPTLALSHIAEEADKLWAAGIPLVLSGHTHAGQITVARLHEWSLGRVAGHRYVHGLYGTRHDPTPRGAVYVGAGIGAAVMPLRLGERARREVTLFDLGVHPAEAEHIAEHHAEQDAFPGRKPSKATRAKRHAKVHRLAERRAERSRRKADRRMRRSD